MLGNPGKRPLPETSNIVLLPAVNEIPGPNRPLFKFGRELWDRVWTKNGHHLFQKC
jgi:hypothetical protein